MAQYDSRTHSTTRAKSEKSENPKWKKGTRKKKQNKKFCTVYMIYCRLNGKHLEQANRRPSNEASFDELNISDLN